MPMFAGDNHERLTVRRIRLTTPARPSRPPVRLGARETISRAPARLVPATPGTKRTRLRAVGGCWVRTPSDWSDRGNAHPRNATEIAGPRCRRRLIAALCLPLLTQAAACCAVTTSTIRTARGGDDPRITSSSPTQARPSYQRTSTGAPLSAPTWDFAGSSISAPRAARLRNDETIRDAAPDRLDEQSKRDRRQCLATA